MFCKIEFDFNPNPNYIIYFKRIGHLFKLKKIKQGFTEIKELFIRVESPISPKHKGTFISMFNILIIYVFKK